jgi:peptide/nickel transport system substrate-binding protein
MSRRRTTVVTALALPLLVSTLAACGSSAASSASPGHSAVETAEASSAVTIAVSSLPTLADIDPKSSSDSIASQNTAENIAGTLFSYDGSSANPDTASSIPAPSPDLALSGTPSASGLTWTFKLRPHVLSQDGNPLTAADVVWTIKRALHTAQSGATLLDGIHINPKNPATATGPLTVQLNLTAPDSLVEKTLAVSFLGILDEKAVVAKSPATDPYGYTYLGSHSATFGPYEVSTDELPNKIVLTANPHYWGGAPEITRATFVQIADDSTRLEAALSGQVDYAAGLQSTDLATIKSSSDKAYLQPNAILDLYAIFELKNASVQNATVRRALSMAIDRKQIATTAYAGLATPITSCVPSSLYSGGTPTYPAAGDPAAAKQLLATVSGAPTSLSIGYPTVSPGASEIAEVMQAGMQAAGVTVTLDPIAAYSTFVADQAAGKFAIGLGGIGPNVVDPGYILYATLDGKSTYDLGAYQSTTFDAMALKMQSTTGAAHETALAKTCDIANQDEPLAPLVNLGGLGAVSPKFTKLSSFGQLPILYNMRYQ